MRFITYSSSGRLGIGIRSPNGYLGLLEDEPEYPGDLHSLLEQGDAALCRAGQALGQGRVVDPAAVTLLPPLPTPGKIICVGLNYADHSAESGFKQPEYPAIFARYASSLVAHGAPIVRPSVSQQLDFEGEVVAVIGTGGRGINAAHALDHVAGYSLFNDASIRDYQFKTAQWIMGKTFDDTGAFGPEFVTADELPVGCKGLRLVTTLNDATVQNAALDDMVFDVAALVVLISEVMTLAPGDIIVTGTPAGVGVGRKPPLWMQPGDICAVEVEGIGRLSNPIIEEVARAA
ncbi:fumarylacetoacetate hydrolase family protein [Lichenicoccus sp.]|uniref:fumarylacetoacetate hydrolase family protein n=1 Tax=Lichenicoccus sp. TaxID=2781899 RepID=UPI003D0B9302